MSDIDEWEPEAVLEYARFLVRKHTEQEAEIERLRAALKAVEWRCVGDNGETYCPVCNATEEEGHEPSCMVLAALHPAPIQKEEK